MATVQRELSGGFRQQAQRILDARKQAYSPHESKEALFIAECMARNVSEQAALAALGRARSVRGLSWMHIHNARRRSRHQNQEPQAEPLRRELEPTPRISGPFRRLVWWILKTRKEIFPKDRWDEMVQLAEQQAGRQGMQVVMRDLREAASFADLMQRWRIEVKPLQPTVEEEEPLKRRIRETVFIRFMGQPDAERIVLKIAQRFGEKTAMDALARAGNIESLEAIQEELEKGYADAAHGGGGVVNFFKTTEAPELSDHFQMQRLQAAIFRIVNEAFHQYPEGDKTDVKRYILSALQAHMGNPERQEQIMEAAIEAWGINDLTVRLNRLTVGEENGNVTDDASRETHETSWSPLEMHFLRDAMGLTTLGVKQLEKGDRGMAKAVDDQLKILLHIAGDRPLAHEYISIVQRRFCNGWNAQQLFGRTLTPHQRRRKLDGIVMSVQDLGMVWIRFQQSNPGPRDVPAPIPFPDRKRVMGILGESVSGIRHQHP